MATDTYHPEPYWSEVARKIDARDGVNVIAGDDEPYYVYKRKKLLDLLLELDFAGKEVLEIGPGPGGNLLEVAKQNPARLVGADISQAMIDIAQKRLGEQATIFKTNGQQLPFADATLDLVFSVTVLQHNSDDAMMRGMLGEMARVSRDEVVLFEQVAPRIAGTDLMMARPIAYYAEVMRTHGYELVDRRMINIVASYYVSGAVRKLFNPSSRKEGEPLTPLALTLQRATLPLTRLLDPLISVERDLARMRFRRSAQVEPSK